MSQQKYTIADIPVLEVEIYSYLAEFTYLYNRNKKLTDLRQHIDYYKKIVTALARYLQKSARNKRDGHNNAYAENETQEIIETLPMSEILDIAKYPSKAKQAVEKYILPFRTFELVVMPSDSYQSNQCTPYDCIADVNLLSQYGTTFRDVLSGVSSLRQIYRPMQSHLPLMESSTLKTNPSQNPVEILYSTRKPDSERTYTIWIAPKICIKTKFKTDKSLSEYMADKPLLEESLMHLISKTREIYDNMDKNLSTAEQQDYVTRSFYQIQMDTAIREHQRLSEIYVLLAVEKLNDLLHICNKNKSINQYLTDLRDSLAHTAEFNLNPEQYLPQVKKDIIKILASVLNKREADIIQSIANASQQKIYKKDNAHLILFLDQQKILRETLIHVLNLQGDDTKGSVFVKQKLITKAEGKFLDKAWQERKQLCHEKIINITTDMNEYLRILNKIYIGIYQKMQNQTQVNTQQPASAYLQNMTVQLVSTNGHLPYYHPQILNEMNQTTQSGSTCNIAIREKFPFLTKLATMTGQITESDFDVLLKLTDVMNDAVHGNGTSMITGLHSFALAKESFDKTKNRHKDNVTSNYAQSGNMPTNSISLSFMSENKNRAVNKEILNFYFKSNQQNDRNE